MGGSALAMQTEERRLLWCCIVQKLIVAMQIYRNAERVLCATDAGHVIDVGMGQQNALH